MSRQVHKHSPAQLFAATFFAVVLTSLTACSSVPNAEPTPYQAAKKIGQGYGYSSVQLSENTYRVMFKATDRTAADRVQEYTLLRAAEIARQNNFDWVSIVKTNIEKKASKGKTITRNDAGSGPMAPPEQQCTMSGCTEVAQPFGAAAGDMDMEVMPMNDIYYSILVRMGTVEEPQDDKAIAVDDILANRPKGN